MTQEPSPQDKRQPATMPNVEVVARELATAKSMDDFFGREGIFARLFAQTMEQMLEAELTAHLGYEPYAVEGRNSGNSRNGQYTKRLRTGTGEVQIEVPRDRNGSFEPQIVPKGQTKTNELEDKIIAMYARGQSVRDIAATLAELYGMEVSAATISSVTDKVWPLVQEWQNRPLSGIYAIVYLDAIHVKLRREGKVENVPVYVVLGVDLEGQRDVLGHWIGDGSEGANFWLGVLSDLKSRGATRLLIACVDGLTGFPEAIRAAFPGTIVQRCIIHQIRNTLRYITWKDRKAVIASLKAIYRAPNREQAEIALDRFELDWGKKYPAAVKSWRVNWDELSAFLDFAPEIRRLIYTTNAVEAYHRQLRKVTKAKGAFPTSESVRKMFFLAHRDIAKKATAPVFNWPIILNQLAIAFDIELSY